MNYINKRSQEGQFLTRPVYLHKLYGVVLRHWREARQIQKIGGDVSPSGYAYEANYWWKFVHRVTHTVSAIGADLVVPNIVDRIWLYCHYFAGDFYSDSDVCVV